MYTLSEEQKDIKRAARDFAVKEIVKVLEDCDAQENFPKSVWQHACKLGFIGIFIGENYNGAGLGILEHLLVLEEFWRIDGGCGNMLLTTLGAENILKFGNEHQRKTMLPSLPNGKAIIGTIADRNGLLNGFQYRKDNTQKMVLNGECGFLLNGELVDKIVVYASSAEAGQVDKKYTGFIIDRNQEGVNIHNIVDKLGVRATPIARLRLADAVADADNVIGREGEGLAQIEFLLDAICLYSAAQSIGLTQGCLERSMKYGNGRVQFGHPITHYQLTKFKLAEMISKIEIARGLCHDLAAGFQQNAYDRKLPVILSLFAKEMASYAASEALQIHGGFGYIKETGIERICRDAQFLNFLGYTNEEAKLFLAQQQSKQ